MEYNGLGDQEIKVVYNTLDKLKSNLKNNEWKLKVNTISKIKTYLINPLITSLGYSVFDMDEVEEDRDGELYLKYNKICKVSISLYTDESDYNKCLDRLKRKEYPKSVEVLICTNGNKYELYYRSSMSGQIYGKICKSFVLSELGIFESNDLFQLISLHKSVIKDLQVAELVIEEKFAEEMSRVSTDIFTSYAPDYIIKAIISNLHLNIDVDKAKNIIDKSKDKIVKFGSAIGEVDLSELIGESDDIKDIEEKTKVIKIETITMLNKAESDKAKAKKLQDTNAENLVKYEKENERILKMLCESEKLKKQISSENDDLKATLERVDKLKDEAASSEKLAKQKKEETVKMEQEIIKICNNTKDKEKEAKRLEEQALKDEAEAKVIANRALLKKIQAKKDLEEAEKKEESAKNKLENAKKIEEEANKKHAQIIEINKKLDKEKRDLGQQDKEIKEYNTYDLAKVDNYLNSFWETQQICKIYFKDLNKFVPINHRYELVSKLLIELIESYNLSMDILKNKIKCLHIDDCGDVYYPKYIRDIKGHDVYIRNQTSGYINTCKRILNEAKIGSQKVILYTKSK